MAPEVVGSGHAAGCSEEGGFPDGNWIMTTELYKNTFAHAWHRGTRVNVLVGATERKCMFLLPLLDTQTAGEVSSCA